jgi:hypothetical protein
MYCFFFSIIYLQKLLIIGPACKKQKWVKNIHFYDQEKLKEENRNFKNDMYMIGKNFGGSGWYMWFFLFGW